MSELHLGLSEVEVIRVWKHMDGRGRGVVNEREFLRAVKSWRFLRRLVTHIASGKVPFCVPAGYDFSKSTQENYANSNSEEFFGDFAKYRARMDRTYHGNYTQERQRWQDAVIKRVAVRIESQPEPWVVYTCGAMGAGKGYALSYMSKIGAFPLENIVHIDPDAFKQVMPEWRFYLAADSASAGTLCHRESGYLQEIAQEVSMANSQNVWVDGSLRDGDWFCEVFDSLRRRFPEYRVAIFLVQASEEVAWERCQARAVQTGRDIPRGLFLDSIFAPDKVLSLLTPKVDFVARISNNGPVPVLEAFESVDTTGDWDSIKNMFGKYEREPAESPHPCSPADDESDTAVSPTHCSRSRSSTMDQGAGAPPVETVLTSPRYDPADEHGDDGIDGPVVGASKFVDGVGVSSSKPRRSAPITTIPLHLGELCEQLSDASAPTACLSLPFCWFVRCDSVPARVLPGPDSFHGVERARWRQLPWRRAGDGPRAPAQPAIVCFGPTAHPGFGRTSERCGIFTVRDPFSGPGVRSRAGVLNALDCSDTTRGVLSSLRVSCDANACLSRSGGTEREV
jgi:hypothetical protein